MYVVRIVFNCAAAYYLGPLVARVPGSTFVTNII